MNTTPEKNTNTTEEVDLGQLFKLIGNGLRSFFDWIGMILMRLFLAFVWIVFFIKKHIVILGTAVIAGFLIGFAIEKLSKPSYISESIVRQNYSTGATLNDYIEYLNNLVIAGDSINLGNKLNITADEASQLTGFGIESGFFAHITQGTFNVFSFVYQTNNLFHTEFIYKIGK